MGRVAGSYGVRGWLKAVPGGGGGEGLLATRQWWLGDLAYAVEEARVHGGGIVAKLCGLETREQVLALKGAVISVKREALPDPGEGRYYLSDLVGLEVVNERGEALGVVRRLFSNGAQDVMEVGGNGTERLLPWVPAVVKSVDLSARRIRVEWQLDW
jgi:16S rRNA processing protein RimM